MLWGKAMEPSSPPQAGRAAGDAAACRSLAGNSPCQEQARDRRVPQAAGWPGKAGSDPDLDTCILQETLRKPRAFQGCETRIGR